MGATNATATTAIIEFVILTFPAQNKKLLHIETGHFIDKYMVNTPKHTVVNSKIILSTI